MLAGKRTRESKALLCHVVMNALSEGVFSIWTGLPCMADEWAFADLVGSKAAVRSR